MVDRATSASIIEKLRKIFATHGVPKNIVSDNGSVFTSEEMKNNIRHIRTAPFHPSSNGMAERYVQTFKKNYAET